MSEKPNRRMIMGIMIAITLALLAAHDGHLTADATTPQGGDCRDLRRACEMKDELGEGDDNCVKFRKTCSPSTPHVNCEWMRDACMYREELGIEGDNNCGRYGENWHEGSIKEP